jgi:U2 small nuclear ribonucleoprotein B''
MAQPSTTLYVNNLHDGLAKAELRAQLYAIFATYGQVLDVVALKGPRMKGQAFLVFAELAAATAAMRALEGMAFYDKPMVRRFAALCSSCLTRRSESHMPNQSRTRPSGGRTRTGSRPPSSRPRA